MKEIYALQTIPWLEFTKGNYLVEYSISR
jgi:hypothetical protein